MLRPAPDNTIVDCNLGTGGHSLALLEECGGKGFLVGLDLDSDMLQLARDRFRSSSIPSSSYRFVHANHADLAEVMSALGRTHAHRILMDLGTSSLHYDTPERGFTCTVDGPLDMRYDRLGKGPTAAEIVNTWEPEDLARLFLQKGDERWAGRISKRLAERRRAQPFRSTMDLADEVGAAIPRKAWPPRIHPATRVFLALRVEVNGEDVALRKALESAVEILAPGGRLAVLTFQSHEDRVVKHFFRSLCADTIDEADPWGRVIEPARFRDLTRKPMRPSPEEVAENPRARSTKLRVVEKLSER